MTEMLRRCGGLLAALLGSLAVCASALAEENAIEALHVAQKGGSVIVKLQLREALRELPASFSVANPARIAIDLPKTLNALDRSVHTYNEGDLRSVNVVSVGDRTRVVLNLDAQSTYEMRLDGRDLYATVQRVAPTAASAAPTVFSEARSASGHVIRDVSFRRGKDGEGRIVVDLSDATTGIDIRQQGQTLVVDFAETTLPEALRKRSDVTDFATPVTSMVATQAGRNARLTLTPKGLWEHSAYQSDNQFVIEVRPITENPNKLVQGTKGGYQGDKLSLNFQNVDVRRLLQVIGEFTGLNIVVSDTVGGSITLILRDVPWDQALDIVLQQKGLDMRKNGNVVLVAPREELATKEKLELEAKQQISDLEPVRTESFQLNYQKAEAVQKLLTDPVQKMLSKRGSAVVDLRTNILFVQDTPSRLDEVRTLLAKIDVPVRQVLIEARIVEATDTFSRNLGVRLGVVDLKGAQGNTGVVGGNLSSNAFLSGQQSTQPSFNESLGVNLPAQRLNNLPPGALSFTLFNTAKTRFLNLELSALEADGRGKIISSPRVVTADQVEALVEQGKELPYLQATASGASSIAYKKAVLSLTVKPQITPDGKITMLVKINKDAPDPTVANAFGIAIDTKKVITEVLVENGGTVVIGGIYTQNSRDTTTKVPVLGDVPMLGNLFRTNERVDDKSELLVFITPRIISESLSLR